MRGPWLMGYQRKDKNTSDNSNHMRFNRRKNSDSFFEGYRDYYESALLILKGKSPKDLRAFHISNSVFEKFQEALKNYQEAWQQLQNQEKSSKKAKKVLHAYYAQDQILDFMDMFIGFLEEPPRAEMDPIIYADKAYFNSLTYIRKMVQRLKEIYEEDPLAIEINDKPLLERPLEYLKDLWSDNAYLRALIDTVIKTEKMRGKMEKEQLSQEEFKKLGEERDLLKELLSNEKMWRYTQYLTEQTLQIENRRKRLVHEISEGKVLYQKLQEVFDSEGNSRLMDDLNPDYGKLQEKTVEEIRHAYQPLLIQIRELQRTFPKKEQ